jgi:hypothetical protein
LIDLKAQAVTVIVVDDEPPVEQNALEGVSAVDHLKQHDVSAVLPHARARNGDVGATLMTEAKQRQANLIVRAGTDILACASGSWAARPMSCCTERMLRS